MSDFGEHLREEREQRLANDRSVSVRQLVGKVSADLQSVILHRPNLFADLIRDLKDLPDRAVLRLVREVSDGDW